MNIILFGPPGAGKGTQAKLLVKKLNGFQISTGDMLRDEITKNTNIGKKIINDMNHGNFVNDEIVNNLILQIVSNPMKKENERTIKSMRMIFLPRTLIEDSPYENGDPIKNIVK